MVRTLRTRSLQTSSRIGSRNEVTNAEEDCKADQTAPDWLVAQAAGADCLSVMCPLCHLMLDAYQSQAVRRLDTRFDLPVLYFTQLMGLALGLGREELGLERNMVSPFRLLERMGLKA